MLLIAQGKVIRYFTFFRNSKLDEIVRLVCLWMFVGNIIQLLLETTPADRTTFAFIFYL